MKSFRKLLYFAVVLALLFTIVSINSINAKSMKKDDLENYVKSGNVNVILCDENGKNHKRVSY